MLKVLGHPVAPQERIKTIDIIRGIALFGILIINYTVDGDNAAPEDGWTGFFDQLAYWGIRLLLDDRFVAIYCFLFGLGFSLMLFRAEQKKTFLFPVFFWRLVILYIIGVALDVFTNISILPSYAMTGVLLLLLYKVPYKLLPVLAVLFFVAPRVYRTSMMQDQREIQQQRTTPKAKVDSTILEKYVGVYHIAFNNSKHVVTRKGDTLLGDGPATHYKLIPHNDSTFFRVDVNAMVTFIKDPNGDVNKFSVKAPNRNFDAVRLNEDVNTALDSQKVSQQNRRVTSGPKSYKEFVSRNWENYKNGIKYWSWPNFFLWANVAFNLPLFLLGLYFGRRRILQDLNNSTSFLRSVMRWGLIIGGVLVAASVAFEAYVYVSKFKEASLSIRSRQMIGALEDIGAILMALGYISLLALLCSKINWNKKLSFFAPVGRMGLTNYILHTIPAVLLFETFSLNLTKEIGPFWRLIIAGFVCYLIYLLSRWWFSHFQMGPFEWIWRSATYFKLQPLRSRHRITEVPEEMHTSVTIADERKEEH